MTTFEQQLKDSLSHAYEIERELGGGGMSRVFVAKELALGRKVVIKVLSPELTAEVNRGRFRREIQVAAQLQHPHIVTLLAAGEHGELVYYTMPFIMGESLKSALDKHGPLWIGDVVRILYDVVDALAYAHGEGVIHRDIKPANILRSGTHALVTDFGVAKALNAAMPSSAMTSTGMAIGTPAYMAPEQLAGDLDADHRIDIYAVGLLAYELLSGKSPFSGLSPQAILAAVLTRDPVQLIEVRTDVPRRLSDLVMSCLSKVPGGRPPTAEAVIKALDTFSTSSGEIRTREHKIPVIGPTVPVITTGLSAKSSGTGALPGPAAVSEPPATVGAPLSGASANAPSSNALSIRAAPQGDVPAPAQSLPIEPARAKSKRRQKLLGGLALMIPVVAVGLYLAQRPSAEPSPATVLPVLPAPVLPAAVLDSATGQVVPAAATAQIAAAPVLRVDSQAIADSAKTRAARAEAAKKAAIAKADSQRRQAQESDSDRARRAAATMLADGSASRLFTRGATRSGGFLGAQRKGDLQTQLDALQPFLAQAGLTYDQFRVVVAESGVSLYDEFGRMVPDALRQFASGGNSQTPK